MKLLAILLRRLRDGVIVLWAAASLTFLGMQHSGGDTALAILGGPDAMPSEALLAQVRAEYGLDQPLWVQYGHYLARLAKGDLGESYRLRIPVVANFGRIGKAQVRRITGRQCCAQYFHAAPAPGASFVVQRDGAVPSSADLHDFLCHGWPPRSWRICINVTNFDINAFEAARFAPAGWRAAFWGVGLKK